MWYILRLLPNIVKISVIVLGWKKSILESDQIQKESGWLPILEYHEPFVWGIKTILSSPRKVAWNHQGQPNEIFSQNSAQLHCSKLNMCEHHQLSSSLLSDAMIKILFLTLVQNTYDKWNDKVVNSFNNVLSSSCLNVVSFHFEFGTIQQEQDMI